MKNRGSGILLHISSLPSDTGIGEFGESCIRFIDYLAQAKQKYWQILPLTATEFVPYSGYSAFAGNIYFINLEELVALKLLNAIDFDNYKKHQLSKKKVEFKKVISLKNELFLKIKMNFSSTLVDNNGDFHKFCQDSNYWLDDFSLYEVLKEIQKENDWHLWEERFKFRHKESLDEIRLNFKKEILFVKFLQFIFFKQWHQIKQYANKKGILIIGDVPIYVGRNSVDVWAHPRIFKLNENLMPSFYGGTPPDIFSSTGQIWKNPVYNWPYLKEHGFWWWKCRFDHNKWLCDILRLDHILGLVKYWEIPSDTLDARTGHFVDVPWFDLFKTLMGQAQSDKITVIGEDLGIVPWELHHAMKVFNIPGMRLLMYGTGSDKSSSFCLHHHEKNSVLYFGTHDNNTMCGWFKKEATILEKKSLQRYFGVRFDKKNFNKKMIQYLMMSVSDIVILQMQDVLGQSDKFRMNNPLSYMTLSKGSENWCYRITDQCLKKHDAIFLADLSGRYDRD